MKKYLLLTVSLTVFAITALAQEAIWPGSALVSPEINDSTGEVTLRLYAPQAQKVEVVGYCTQGYEAMKRDSTGLWT